MGFSASSFATHLLLGFGILSFIQHFSFFLSSFALFTWSRLHYRYFSEFSASTIISNSKGTTFKDDAPGPQCLEKENSPHYTSQKQRIGGGSIRSIDRFLLAAFFIGFIVTLLQSTCTSQVYLPTLLFVMNVPSLREVLIFILYFIIWFTFFHCWLSSASSIGE